MGFFGCNPFPCLPSAKQSHSTSPSTPYLFLNHSFALTKCLHSKKPLAALKGLGCTDLKMQCLFLSTPIESTRFWAGVPHAKNTTPLEDLETAPSTSEVNFSHP